MGLYEHRYAVDMGRLEYCDERFIQSVYKLQLYYRELLQLVSDDHLIGVF